MISRCGICLTYFIDVEFQEIAAINLTECVVTVEDLRDSAPVCFGDFNLFRMLHPDDEKSINEIMQAIIDLAREDYAAHA